MTDRDPTGSSPVLAGRYRLGDVIGRGARAVVHEARDTLLGRTVAIKLFTATADTVEEARLQEAEARLVASLDHFALTTLFDAGADLSDPEHPRIFLVMERVKGADLRVRLRDGALTPAQVMNLGSDLAQGLEAVHEHGFLHRDVKPANVLVTRRGRSSRIRGKLTDFGISSIIGVPDDDEFTNGTAAYLSPEQVDGEDPGPAADVYSLGLVLLEALTGRVAFPGSVEDSAFARLDRDPEVPDTIAAPLARVLRAMTARDPAERPKPGQAAVALQDAYVQGLVRSRRVDSDVLAHDEAERLAAVRRLAVQDPGPDEAIDRVARLARQLMGASVATVSIADAEREWVKAAEGASVPPVGRSAGFAHESVSSGAVHVIEDVRDDPRSTDHPLLAQRPELRSYASAPLVSADGHAVGVLAVLTEQVRPFTEDELRGLVDLAAVAARELELRAVGRAAQFDG